ncbi:hypothetical protein D0Y65_018728 [Glycine soja]|uniref:Uncharacterized protein n=1 Tax=Glycine soja TaxID=3848 RepID=A0A445K0G2_GLYSO|nr:hypothetical protein D0Y65_018728 [Glycine soja]
MLVLGRLSAGDMLTQIPLFNIPFWVQLNDVPTGFVTPMVGKHMENFIREFLEYDSKNNTGGSRPFMRIKVLVGLRNPLKTGKKLRKPEGEWQMIQSNCERLGPRSQASRSYDHLELELKRLGSPPCSSNFTRLGSVQQTKRMAEVGSSTAMEGERQLDFRFENSRLVEEDLTSIVEGVGPVIPMEMLPQSCNVVLMMI